MATYASCHARSISLPSRHHPTLSHFDEHLTRLRSSESASTSFSSITHKFNSLKDLYECVDDLLLLPSNVQALSQDCQETNDILEGSLSLLDVCGASRDILSQIKERVQDIQSALRRRCSGNLSPANEAAAYIKCRKEAERVVKTSLKSIRNVQKKCSNQLEKNNGKIMMVDALMKMETATAEILESLLAQIAGPKKHSLVSKLMGQVQKEESRNGSEFAEMDASVQSMISQKKFNLESVQVHMGDLELTIQDFTEVLESLLRCSVKTRANILNILSH